MQNEEMQLSDRTLRNAATRAVKSIAIEIANLLPKDILGDIARAQIALENARNEFKMKESQFKQEVYEAFRGRI